jgi:hypothetical protein
MSDPIGLREFNEAAYRNFIRTLSDEELIKAGKRLSHSVRRCCHRDSEHVR